MKSTMTFDEMMIKAPYRSILTLLTKFGQKEGGLRPMHLRYALIKDHGVHKHFRLEIEKFFGEELEKLTTPVLPGVEPEVVKGCIPSRQRLTNILQKLRDLGIVEKDEKNKFDVRYYLTKKYVGEIFRLRVARRVNFWDSDKIIETEEEGFHFGTTGGLDYVTLFGYGFDEIMPIEQLDDYMEINKCISNIKKDARRILEIRCKHKQKKKITLDEYKNKFVQSGKTQKNELKNVIQSSTFSLFYNGEVNYIKNGSNKKEKN